MPQDKDHPYGHGRAETIGATLIGLFIIATGIGVIYETWQAIIEEPGRTPGLLAIIAATLSIAINEGLFYYNRRVGIEIKKHSGLIDLMSGLKFGFNVCH